MDFAGPRAPRRTIGLPRLDNLAGPVRPGEIVAGRYRIEGICGRGSTSVVYRARHLELGSLVAIKILAPLGMPLDDTALDRFEFEARLLADLRHHRIVTVIDCGKTDDGLRYIAMEFLHGETLRARLRREERLSLSCMVRVAAQIADALAIIHARGIVHRDIKPSNVCLVGDAPDVKLMDFGLAQAPALAADCAQLSSESGPRRRLRTEHGLILGTAAYMSPELILGRQLDARSDVYALGVLSYRMLTGTLPFSGGSIASVLDRHLREPVEPMRARAPHLNIPTLLDEVVSRALSKEREQRPASASEFSRQLVLAMDTAGPELDTVIPITIEGEDDRIEPKGRRFKARRRRLGFATLACVASTVMLGSHGVSFLPSAGDTPTKQHESGKRQAVRVAPHVPVAPSASVDIDIDGGAAAVGQRARPSSVERRGPTTPARSDRALSTYARRHDLKIPNWDRRVR